MLRLPSRVAALACVITMIAAPARAGALFNATALTAANGYQPTVEGFDNSGRVLLWNTFAPAGAPSYSLYSPQGGSITPLVGSDSESQKTQFIPQHISGNGQMVGWVGGQPVLSSGGQTTALPAWGQAVNDSGQVAVLRDWTTDHTTSSIVSHGKETPLGLVPGYDSTGVVAINNAGQATGTASADLHGGGTYLSQPFFYDGQRLIPLGTFGGPNGYAVGINNKGDVIGQAGDASNLEIGFVSHNGGPLIKLGTLPGSWSSQPTGINDSGQIIGRALGLPNGGAFLYQNGALTDLNTLLSPSAHLTVTDVYFINNAGQIVAEGFLDGVKWPQLFLLTPDDQPAPPSPDPLVQMVPEPSTLAVFVLTLAGVCTHHRRRTSRGAGAARHLLI